jgi:hypothetical protein
MAKKKATKQKASRSLNAEAGKGKSAKAPKAKKPAGVGNDQDTKRRLGNFGGAGEHPRQGGRTSGIVGQTKQKNKTDK